MMGNSRLDCDVTLYMTLLSIAMRLADLIEWVDPVNDRFDYTRFDQSFENQQIFDFLAAAGAHTSPPSAPRA